MRGDVLAAGIAHRLPQIFSDSVAILELFQICAQSFAEAIVAKIRVHHAVDAGALRVGDAIVDVLNLIRIAYLHLHKAQCSKNEIISPLRHTSIGCDEARPSSMRPRMTSSLAKRIQILNSG